MHTAKGRMTCIIAAAAIDQTGTTTVGSLPAASILLDRRYYL